VIDLVVDPAFELATAMASSSGCGSSVAVVTHDPGSFVEHVRVRGVSVRDGQFGQLVVAEAAAVDLGRPAVGGVDRERDRAQGQLVRVPQLNPPLGPTARDPLGAGRLVLVVRIGEPRPPPLCGRTGDTRRPGWEWVCRPDPAVRHGSPR
jgi:hypothetical protein